MLNNQHTLVQLRDGQINLLASLILIALPTLACLFWYLARLSLFLIIELTLGSGPLASHYGQLMLYIPQPQMLGALMLIYCILF